jgi:hypothetical protein
VIAEPKVQRSVGAFYIVSGIWMGSAGDTRTDGGVRLFFDALNKANATILQPLKMNPLGAAHKRG